MEISNSLLCKNVHRKQNQDLHHNLTKEAKARINQLVSRSLHDGNIGINLINGIKKIPEEREARKQVEWNWNWSWTLIMENLSALTYNFIQVVLSGASYLKIIPIQRISKSSLRISRFRSKRSNICYWLAALQLVGYWLYLTITFYMEFVEFSLAKSKSAKSSSLMFIHLLKLAIYGIAASFQCTLLVKQEQAVKVINGVDSVYQHFESKGIECDQWWSSIFTVFPFLYLGFLTIIIPPFFSCIFFFESNNPMFFFSFLEPHIVESLILFAKLGFGIFEFYSAISTMLTILFVMIEVWGFVLSTRNWLQLLMKDSDSFPPYHGQKKQKQEPIKVFYINSFHHDVSSKMKFYKQLKILTIFHNEFVHILASSATVVYCGAVTLCIYACMIAHEVLPSHIYILFPVVVTIMVFFIFVTYGEVAQVSLFSSQCLETFKKDIRKNLGGRFFKDQLQYEEWKSLSPLGVHLFTGNFDVSTPQEMMEQILNFVILLLQL